MKATLTILGACVVALFAAAPGAAGAQPSVEMADLTRQIEDFRDDRNIPGLAVGVLHGGEIVFSHASGVRARNRPATATEHTLFGAASISKTLTATAVMQLVAEGELQLDRPVGAVLDDFDGLPITIRHLLTHTSGLDDRPGPSNRSGEDAVARYLERLAGRELLFEPGSGWAYSDSGFNVLGAVVSELRGAPFAEVMRARILAPLGITRGGFIMRHSDPDTALPHRQGLFGVARVDNPDHDQAFLPSSGLHVSVRDLLRWAEATLSRDERLLPGAMFDRMLERQRPTEWDGIDIALGWQLEDSRFGRLPRHAGDAGGMSSLLTLYPEDGAAIAILTNLEDAPRFALRAIVEDALTAQGLLSD